MLINIFLFLKNCNLFLQLNNFKTMLDKVNPFNELGFIHNDFLTYIISNNANPGADDLRQLFADYASIAFDDATPAFISECKIIAGFAINSQFVNTGVIGGGKIWSGRQIPFLNRILDTASYPPEPYYASIEDDILTSDLTPAESSILLCATGIARASGLYWEGAYNNVLDPWHNELPGQANVLGATLEDAMAGLEMWVFLNENADELKERGYKTVWNPWVIGGYAALKSAA